MSAHIALVVGLGNPGSRYEDTRHNAGFWFIDQLARSKGETLRRESRFHGEVCRVTLAGQDVWLLKPDTFMNRSGQSVGALATFYKIPPEKILVVHDELDLPTGTLRLKVGGGHGGHNGLRDIIAHLGGNQFARLRVGIGHPGNSREVADYVLKAPGKAEHEQIVQSLQQAEIYLTQVVAGDMQKAMNHLHSQK